jgi:hypothetical protein
MKTSVEVVEKWFAEKREALAASGGSVSIRSVEPIEAERGKVSISLQSEKISATVTLWNLQRQIEVIALDPMESDPRVLIDRALYPGEEIVPLLNRIFHQIAAESPSFAAIQGP